MIQVALLCHDDGKYHAKLKSEFQQNTIIGLPPLSILQISYRMSFWEKGKEGEKDVEVIFITDEILRLLDRIL